MIDRQKVARAIVAVYDAHRPSGAASDLTPCPTDAKAADAAIAAVLGQLPKAELDYAVAQLRHAYPIIERAPLKEPAEFAHGLIAPQIRRIERFLNFLQPQESTNPAE